MRKWKAGWFLLATAMTMAGLTMADLTWPSPAAAQDQTDRPRLHRRPPLRVHVTPGVSGRLYRECTDWHVIEHRATGDTVVPRIRCWWALR